MKRAWRSRAALLLVAAAPALAVADQGTDNGASPSTTADLEFLVDIGKFLFFRVGSGGFPTASGTIDTVALDVGMTIPPGAVMAVPGAGTTVNWGGTAPAFVAPSANVPVEVRSNAGQITIRANVVSTLTSGGNVIPMSQILLASSDPGLPAPTLPNTGMSATVNVAGTAFSNLVTQRLATWTFSYVPVPTQRAGTYTGQISFTASSP
ncbi:hypothetical protein H8N03_19355 [Ramlibacter sp. USB13]|uniref:WxL domain-containing protein n=1 Tax=Ramlibacter cellulosilyticus TaxID=2764187 RepID=A0A923SDA0_9BURK|nr:hypothetical protein [Ramlibacter cellulosilyticus]MBC5785113.1 hypothetical protein [Ramlibacter cellulosilyticus]